MWHGILCGATQAADKEGTAPGRGTELAGCRVSVAMVDRPGGSLAKCLTVTQERTPMGGSEHNPPIAEKDFLVVWFACKY